MHTTENLLGNISLSTFLNEYWQQKPLLIHSAIPGYSSPISADELAGLACEPDVESRIILEKSTSAWECRHGPFAENDFSQLPETHWTLLVQSCNLYVTELAQLLEQFRFIPNWRVDDIMVSYAAPGGSVGPHTDHYDVFLLQAQGRRRWSISTRPTVDEGFFPDLDVKILKSFEPEQSWILGPGDMLYLPPGVAHHGVAVQDIDAKTSSGSAAPGSKQQDCITISIGFRAPNVMELGTALLDEILVKSETSQQLSTEKNSLQQIKKKGVDLDTIFYSDPQLPLQDNSGEITPLALQGINHLVQQELTKKIDDPDWFGKYITLTNEEVERAEWEQDPADILQLLKNGRQLVRDEGSKFVFVTVQNSKHKEQDKIHFFYNGNVVYCSIRLHNFVKLVCNSRYLSSALLIATLSNSESLDLLCELVNQGYLVFVQKQEQENDARD